MPGFIRFAANSKNAKLNPCPASSSFSDQTSHYLSDAACIQKPCCLCWTCELISPLMSSSEQFKPKGPANKASWKRILICIFDTCLCWETMSSGLSKSLLWMLLVHGWKAGIANILPPCHMLWICISGSAEHSMLYQTTTKYVNISLRLCDCFIPGPCSLYFNVSTVWNALPTFILIHFTFIP